MFLSLAAPISDGNVLTGRQKPLTEIAFLFAEIETEGRHSGIGYNYSKRAGSPGQFAHAKEVACELIGGDPSDITRLWDKLVWAGASVGRSGISTQAVAAFDIALWDLQAKRAGLPLAKLLGAHRDSVRCYNTSGGYLSMRIGDVKERITMALNKGIGAMNHEGYAALAAELATPIETGEMLTRACYALVISFSACLSMRQTKATICRPANVVA